MAAISGINQQLQSHSPARIAAIVRDEVANQLAMERDAETTKTKHIHKSPSRRAKGSDKSDSPHPSEEDDTTDDDTETESDHASESSSRRSARSTEIKSLSTAAVTSLRAAGTLEPATIPHFVRIFSVRCSGHHDTIKEVLKLREPPSKPSLIKADEWLGALEGRNPFKSLPIFRTTPYTCIFSERKSR